MTQRVLGPRKSARRRWIGAGTAVFATGLVLVFFAVSASARQGSSAISLACPAVGASLLTGSNLEIDTNANLKTEGTSPCTDWNAVINPPGAGTGPAVVKSDTLSGGGDDSFTNGSAINDIPKIDSGSIPPSKSDLKSFGVWQEGTGGASVLNLFWSRVQDPNGTTDMDFEFNQNFCDSVNPTAPGSTCDDNTPNGGKTTIKVTPTRVAGDLLVTYLLSSGGTNPTIKYRTWGCSGATCAWSAPTDLTSSVAIGSINTTAILAANSDIGSQSAFTFGEASLNVSVILGTADCRTFGSAYLKSRASDTDSTAGKDFIAPVRVSVTNCGSVVVKKVDNAATPNRLSGATFTIEKGKLAGGVENASDTLAEGTGNKTGFYCIDNIKLDSGGSTHKVTETTAPTGYDKPNPDNQTVSVSNTNSCATRLAQAVPIADVVVDLTFVDTPQLGAIKIVKQAKDKNCATAASASGSTLLKCTATVGTALLSGATFQICTNAGPYNAGNPCSQVTGSPVTTSSVNDSTFGTACVGSLPSATGTTYYIHETGSGSANFSADATDQSVTLSGNSTCPSPGAANTKTFTDNPLSKIDVTFTSSAGTGITRAKISCTGLTPDTVDSTPDDYDDTAEAFSGLVPNTSTGYNCTVLVDP